MSDKFFKAWFAFVAVLCVVILGVAIWAIIRLVPAFEHLLNSIPTE